MYFNINVISTYHSSERISDIIASISLIRFWKLFLKMILLIDFHITSSTEIVDLNIVYERYMPAILQHFVNIFHCIETIIGYTCYDIPPYYMSV